MFSVASLKFRDPNGLNEWLYFGLLRLGLDGLEPDMDWVTGLDPPNPRVDVFQVWIQSNTNERGLTRPSAKILGKFNLQPQNLYVIF